MEWREVLESRSQAAIAAFVREHPEYSVDAAQPRCRGGTNRITMAHRNDARVVFKYFDAAERFRNELCCLQHFAATGLVPRVLDAVPEKLLVMTRLASDGIARDELDAAACTRVSAEIGVALARLAKVPRRKPQSGYDPATDFQIILWAPTPRAAVEVYLERARRIHAGIPEYGAPVFGASLRLLEETLDTVAAQELILWHEDIGNLAVGDGHFAGFFDFEMCRGGTEAMQLGVAFGLCHALKFDWPALLNAYETAMGRTLESRARLAVLAMAHFYSWIRICRWGWWNGDPGDTAHRQETVADVKWYVDALRATICGMQAVVELPDYLLAVR